jgi:cation-transporting ATPase 13A3/4/5
MFITAGLVLMSASMVLFPSQWVKSFMQLLDIPLSFKLFILMMAGLHLLIALTSERVMFPILATKIGKMIQSIRKRSSPPLPSMTTTPATTTTTANRTGLSNSQRDPHRRSSQYGDEARVDVSEGHEDEQGSGPGTPLIGSDPQSPLDQIGRGGSGSVDKEVVRKGKIYKVVQEEMNFT